MLDTIPRYAPEKILIIHNGQPITCPVTSYIIDPPGHNSPIIANNLTCLTLVTKYGKRYYGFNHCYINSELKPVVIGFSSNDEVRRNWQICQIPL